MNLLLKCVFVIWCWSTVFCGIDRRKVDNSANERARQAYNLIKKKLNETNGCKDLLGIEDCSNLRRYRHQMRIYMASKKQLQLNAVMTEYFHREFTELEAVVVVDPIPEAHFGHTLVLILSYAGLSKTECDNKEGSYYNQGGVTECLVFPDTKKCLIHKQLSGDAFKTSCTVTFLPQVYEKASLELQNKLQCMDELEGFASCPTVHAQSDTRCNNAIKCEQPSNHLKESCKWKCDYGLMIFGGWDKHTQSVRHLHNIKDMFKYLKNKGYNDKNIRIFFANNSTIDLDGNPNTQDTLPADDSNVISNHLKHVCELNEHCIDTLTIYLNGPTLRNGDILLWDKNKDGTASDFGKLSINKLLSPLENCGAKDIIIIADQNHAGHIIDEVTKGRKRGIKNFNNIFVIASSAKDTYTYKRDFTQKFIQLDNVHIDSSTSIATSRLLVNISKDLKELLKTKNKIDFLESDNINLSITGNQFLPPGCTTNIKYVSDSLEWTDKSTLK
ncbi:uncharacterized protein LOC100214463 isoform X1 [Hydra vulgaris]|uniref:uncharacterized protein LOC100214463 isoform X1 n=1 Tax=Hydra vulgaris TaxID=6087 RepID=UPI00064138C8|nr:uncharacterized protein LOC100214463 [Hydra vulgaris]